MALRMALKLRAKGWEWTLKKWQGLASPHEQGLEEEIKCVNKRDFHSSNC